MYRQLERPEPNVFGFEVSGTIAREDVDAIAAKLKHAIENNGRVRLLLRMRDVDGITPGALWEDLKFATIYSNDIERMAVLGDRKWEEWLTEFSGVGEPTEVKYFDIGNTENAWRWLRAA